MAVKKINNIYELGEVVREAELEQQEDVKVELIDGSVYDARELSKEVDKAIVEGAREDNDEKIKELPAPLQESARAEIPETKIKHPSLDEIRRGLK